MESPDGRDNVKARTLWEAVVTGEARQRYRDAMQIEQGAAASPAVPRRGDEGDVERRDAGPAKSVVVELAGLVRRYGEREALGGVSLSLEERQTLVVFGPN